MANQPITGAPRQRAFAYGGAIDPDAVNLDALRTGAVDPLGSDFDSINAEKTLRWAEEDATKRASYGQAPQMSMAATDLIKGLLGRAPAKQPAAAAQPITVAAPTVAPTAPKASKGFTGMTPGEGAMLKNFDTRQNGYADGGKPETAEQLMARMNAKYGVSSGSQPAAVALTPQPVAPAPQEKPGGLIQQAVGLLGNRHKQIEKAAGYANGGKIKGPGTATSDSIPATTGTGENIRVANGERIVSVAQDQALQRIAEMLGFETVDAMFESMTGKPVGPTMKGGQIAAASGMRPQKDFSGEFLGGLKNWMSSKTPVATEEDAAKLRAADDPFIVTPVGPVGKVVAGQAAKAGVQQYADDTAKAASQSGQNWADEAAGKVYGNTAQGTRDVTGGVTREAERFAAEKAAQDAKFAAAAAQAAAPATAQKAAAGVGRNVVTQATNAAAHNLPTGSAAVAPAAAVSPNPPANQPAESDAPAADPGAAIKEAAAGAAALRERQTTHMENNNLREFRDAGAGITAQRGANGRLSITNVGTESLTDPTNRGLDDSAAAAARHADDVKNGRTPQQTYERMVRNRLLSDATSEQITDPNVRQQAIQGLNIMNAAKQGEATASLQAAQTRGANVQADSAEQSAALQKEYLNPETHPDRRKEIHDYLRALSGKDKEEFKIATVRRPDPSNPMGYIEDAYVVNGRNGSEERKVGSPAAAPATTATKAYKPGDTTKDRAGISYKFKGGDPKDQKNWEKI